MKNLILLGYFIYLPIVIILTVYVAKTLFKNGEQFMLDIFHGEREIALATNKLFEVGFYLLNVGFAFYIIKIYGVNNSQHLVEILSEKVGGFAIYLGFILFFNLFLFMRGRKNARRSRYPEIEENMKLAG